MTTYYHGVRGLVLFYPLFAGFFYTFSPRRALVVSIILGCAGLAVSLNVLEPIFVLRIAVALLVTLIFYLAFASTLTKQHALLHSLASTCKFICLRSRTDLKHEAEEVHMLLFAITLGFLLSVLVILRVLNRSVVPAGLGTGMQY